MQYIYLEILYKMKRKRDIQCEFNVNDYVLFLHEGHFYEGKITLTRANYDCMKYNIHIESLWPLNDYVNCSLVVLHLPIIERHEIYVVCTSSKIVAIPNLKNWRNEISTGHIVRYQDGFKSMYQAYVINRSGDFLEIQILYTRINKIINCNSPRIGLVGCPINKIFSASYTVRPTIDIEREHNDKYFGCQCSVRGRYGFIIEVDYSRNLYCFLETYRYPTRMYFDNYEDHRIQWVSKESIIINQAYNIMQRGIKNLDLSVNQSIRIKLCDTVEDIDENDIHKMIEEGDGDYALKHILSLHHIRRVYQSDPDTLHKIYMLMSKHGIAHRSKFYNPGTDDHYQLDYFMDKAYNELTGVSWFENKTTYKRGKQLEWNERSMNIFDFNLVKIENGTMILNVSYNGVFMSDIFSKASTMNLMYLRFIMDQICPPSYALRNRVRFVSKYSDLFNVSLDLPVPCIGSLYYYQNFLVTEMKKHEEKDCYTSDIFNKHFDKFTYNYIDGFQRKITDKSNSGILCLNPGFGKTVIILELIKRTPQFKTIIVVPLSLIDQWKDECERFVPEFKLTEYYGKKKNYFGQIVLTTYGQIRQFATGLFLKSFDRVIFDESHCVKSIESKTAIGCRDIIASRRWCVTGTPNKTNFESMATQFSMLNIAPWTSVRKECMYDVMEREPTAIDALFSELMFDISPERLDEFQLNPIKASLSDNITIKLKRTNQHISAFFIQYLLDKWSENQNSTPSFVEMLINKLHIIAIDPTLLPLSTFSKRTFGEMATRTVSSMVENIASSSSSTDKYRDEITKGLMELEKSTDSCVICMEPYEHPTITPCFHIFCEECIKSAIKHNELCPICRAPVQQTKLTKLIKPTDGNDNNGMYEFVDITGYKCSVPIEIHKSYVAAEKVIPEKFKYIENEIDDATSIVVFSRFACVLQGLYIHLIKKIPVGIITGKTIRKQRANAIRKFENKEIKIFLLTTKTAAVGINLTSGSKIIFMEPQPDKNIITQAIGRLNRIGQTNDITVKTLITQGSIDEHFCDFRKNIDIEIEEIKEKYKGKKQNTFLKNTRYQHMKRLLNNL